MKSVLLVALGGALGSAARFKLAGWVFQLSASWKFPLGTFLVNILGCLVIGVLAGLGERHNVISETARVFLFVGLLGGFTTFSAFGLETFLLLKRGEILVAGSYAVLSVLLGLALLWLGHTAALLGAK